MQKIKGRIQKIEEKRQNLNESLKSKETLLTLHSAKPISNLTFLLLVFLTL